MPAANNAAAPAIRTSRVAREPNRWRAPRLRPRRAGAEPRSSSMRVLTARGGPESAAYRPRRSSGSGRAKATYSEPDGGPMRPPPAAMTTYCRPSTA